MTREEEKNRTEQEIIARVCEWHEGCKNEGMAFYIVDYEAESEPEGSQPVYEYWYCDEHAGPAGFCLGCAEFWGGVESFEFIPPIYFCDNCKSDPDLFPQDDEEGFIDYDYDEETD